MFRHLMTAILLTVMTMVFSSLIIGQSPSRVPKEVTQVVLNSKTKNLFFMDKVSYYRHHNYILRLKKGQKVEIEMAGWNLRRRLLTNKELLTKMLPVSG